MAVLALALTTQQIIRKELDQGLASTLLARAQPKPQEQQ